MSSVFFRLDRIMSKLLILNNYRLQSLLLCFVLHMPNIIWLNLNHKRMLLTLFGRVLCQIQASEWNLLTLKNYPINHEITLTCQLLLWKQEILWLFDVERNVSIEKQNMMKTYFLKFLVISINFESNQLCRRTTNLFMVNLLSNEFQEKLVICY